MACHCGGDGCALTVFMSTEEVVTWEADPPQASTEPINTDG